MVARTFAAVIEGLEGQPIYLEAVRQKEIPKIHITGLPGDVVRESTHRIAACLAGLGFDVPTARILIHLSPASARKQGSHLDLAIAIAILAVEGHIPLDRPADVALLGELSLDGRVHRVEGAVALFDALHASDAIRTILIPNDNGEEAALVGSQKIRCVSHVSEVIEYFREGKDLARPQPVAEGEGAADTLGIDRVIGQTLAKRAVQIAVAGRHHLLMVGPPGVGKSLLAQSASSLMPPLERHERVEIMKNYVQSGGRVLRTAPFRSPHHSISNAAFLGGGSGVVIPGEVTLAHGGILFLDEFPEFRKDTLEGLREPLETGVIHLHRIGRPLSLPARFTLIAAMNPCPCGYGLDEQACTCLKEKRHQYKSRISGPIYDRLDLRTNMQVPKEGARDRSSSLETMREEIAVALRMQKERYRTAPGIRRNGDCAAEHFPRYFSMDASALKFLSDLMEKAKESLRSLHRLTRVARTIADLEGSEVLTHRHLQQAEGFRCPASSKQLFGF